MDIGRFHNFGLLSDDEVFVSVYYRDEYYPQYMISNYGRLYSIRTDRFIKIRNTKCGYCHYRISVDGVYHEWLVHRLIAISFIDNPEPEQYRIINHRDQNKANNAIKNLEWCDDKYNLNYADTQKRRAAKRSKPVRMMDSECNVIDEYESLNATSRITGLPLSKLWSSCNSGALYAGYYWQYTQSRTDVVNT